LLVFVTAHLGNHVALFWGADHHLAVQEALRPFYRYPLVEPLILLGLFVQLFLGAAILLLFLVQHVGAALYVRAFLPSIDTNIYWAASVVHSKPLSLYFGPYYFLGVSAVFLHIAAFVAWRWRRRRIGVWIAVSGVVFAFALVAALNSAFFTIELPAPYVAYATDLNVFSRAD